MSYAIRVPDYQRPAELTCSTNDEKEKGWGEKEKGVGEKRGGNRS